MGRGKKLPLRWEEKKRMGHPGSQGHKVSKEDRRGLPGAANGQGG